MGLLEDESEIEVHRNGRLGVKKVVAAPGDIPTQDERPRLSEVTVGRPLEGGRDRDERGAGEGS